MTDPLPPTVAWHRGRLRLIDQRALPARLQYVECSTPSEVIRAIRDLVVRGAPAIGAAGGYGVALAAASRDHTPAAVRRAAEALRNARPTAVNLAHGVDRVLAAYEQAAQESTLHERSGGRAAGAAAALAEAHAIAEEDVTANRALGANGVSLIKRDARVLTHCNAGALACVGYGTALGVVRAAAEAGKRPHVWVDETRPILQGARLTAWELDRLGIDHTLIADSAAASLMREGEVDVVIVGADRIAANGDVANKVGTYSLAVLAAHHDVPFVVAAPLTTVDFDTPNGDAIEIEERDPREVTQIGHVRTAPRNTPARNPAFDVTPADLVGAIVTERGVARDPYTDSLRKLAASED